MKIPTINLSDDDKDKFFALVACAYKTHLTTVEAAEFLGTSYQVLKNSRKKKELFGREAPKYRRVGQKKITYSKEKLIEWIDDAPEGTFIGNEK